MGQIYDSIREAELLWTRSATGRGIPMLIYILDLYPLVPGFALDVSNSCRLQEIKGKSFGKRDNTS